MLLGSNPTARVEGAETLPGRTNYFVGKDPAKWRTNIPTYGRVNYKDIYPGVDLTYYGNQGMLEYDFVVAPEADPRKIRFSIGGADDVRLDSTGELTLKVRDGEVRLKKPTLYQRSHGIRREIAGTYVLRGKHEVALRIGRYDTALPLIIDPVLSYSTYLGGIQNDSGAAIAVDSAGDAIVVGSTLSPNFPTKNSLESISAQDVFVAKLDPAGATLIFSTFLGGTGSDSGTGIAVDGAGNLYVTGYTNSTDFPTKNAFQPQLHGIKNTNAFVAKLDPAGSGLIYSTYLGGSGGGSCISGLTPCSGDGATAIAVDASGAAYITGVTDSSDFPTKNAFQAALKTGTGGSADAFVTKLDSTGSQLAYSTYLGGSSPDQGFGIAVDGAGSAYVTGVSHSSDFPAKNPFQASFGGASDAFVTKLDPTGTTLVYSSLLGGSGTDQGNGIAVDSQGNAYIVGTTNSSDFSTVNPVQSSCKACMAGEPNAFVSKVNANGLALGYSTFLGGSGNGGDGDNGVGIAVDSVGDAYVIGVTSSPDFPLANPIQSSFVIQTCNSFYYYYGYSSACGNTAFVTELNSAGSALVYSTYLGALGGDFEAGSGIALDSSGSAYVTGTTTTSDFLVTPGAFQTATGGSSDAFVAKISAADGTGFSLSSLSLNFSDQGIGGTSAPQSISVANTGTVSLSIAGIVTAGDFVTTKTCGGSLAGGTGCALSVSFAPTAAGTRSGSITITDNATGSPQIIALSGNGVAGISTTVSPASLNFQTLTQGTSSAAQTVVLQNNGNVEFNLTGFSIRGTNSTDFFLQSASCNQPQLVAPGGQCKFSVVFNPNEAGNLTATLQILDNSAQSPHNVALTGTALAAPGVAVSPASLSFAAQPIGNTSSPQTVTLTTSGSGTLAISSSGTSVSDFVIASDSCGASVAGNSSCTLTIAFRPTATGNRTGTLVIASNASNGTQMVSLSGTGVSGFSISVAPGSSASMTVNAGQSATFSLNITGVAGFLDTVAVSCSAGIPASSCVVSPSSVTANNTTVAANVTVTTTSRSALPHRFRIPILSPGLRFFVPLMTLAVSLIIFVAAIRRGSRRPAQIAFGVMLGAIALFLGCGGGGGKSNTGTPAGSYTIIITARAPSEIHQISLTLTVQ